MSPAEKNFREVAPPFMDLLIDDFPQLDKYDAAAVFGNAGHESLGFTKLQEIKPTVPRSRGGFGWFQWTASRRVAYEAYCRRNGKDPAAPASNYAWLFIELTTTEARALDALKAARTLKDKVKAFELSFERAGVKHYPSRNQWALIALDAYEKWLADRAEDDANPPPAKPIPEPALADTATIEAVNKLARLTPEQLDTAMRTIALAQAMQRGWRIEDPESPDLPVKATPGITFTQPQEQDMQAKPFFKSKTLIGIALAAIPALFPQTAPLVLPLQELTGVDPQATAAVNDVVNTGIQLIGLLVAAYGRFVADGKISIKG